MSTMLEQAIVDAAALRETAIKSAEQVVIDQYSEQIRETVNQLLEQAPAGDPAADKDAALVKDLDSQLPEAYHPEIDDEQILEIDLHSLKAEDLTKEEIKLAEDDMPLKCSSDEECVEGNMCVDGNCIPGPQQEDVEDVQLQEEELTALAESLKFDYETDTADGGFANGQMVPAGLQDETLARDLALMVKEYSAETEEKNEKLKKENVRLKTRINKLLERKEKLEETIGLIEIKVNEVQLANAKLYYTNRALMDDSLNERQKEKIVESIGEVSSLEQAKIVYETLQGAVGASQTKKPKSLSEAVNKRTSSSILLQSRKSENPKQKRENEFADRMRRLAGIKN